MELFPSIKPTVVVVDDTPDNLLLFEGLLQDMYSVVAVSEGSKALDLILETMPAMVLLDVMMPGMDGYEVCRRIKADIRGQEIPVIFVTGRTEPESENIGMGLGAVDYVTRPINPPVLLSRIKAHLSHAAVSKTLRVNNEYLEYEITKRKRSLQEQQDIAIRTLASLAETRDTDTGLHIQRTQHYVRRLAMRLQAHPRFCRYLSGDMVLTLFKSAPLHDIGKIGIPDRILLKPGPLDEQEIAIMRQHPELGFRALEKAQIHNAYRVEFLEVAKEIIYCHHEKWNGTGYPRGLVADEIPVSARLMALADVYDALICRRVYKRGMAHAEAARIIVEGRGQHFDPDVVDAFISLEAEFIAIAEMYADQPANLERAA